MHNIPPDASRMSWAPWLDEGNQEYADPVMITVCWACDSLESDCRCIDGFDPTQIEKRFYTPNP